MKANEITEVSITKANNGYIVRGFWKKDWQVSTHLTSVFIAKDLPEAFGYTKEIFNESFEEVGDADV